VAIDSVGFCPDSRSSGIDAVHIIIVGIPVVFRSRVGLSETGLNSILMFRISITASET